MEPDAGNRHVRFPCAGWGTARRPHGPSYRASSLSRGGPKPKRSESLAGGTPDIAAQRGFEFCPDSES
jgi:hypothetical protein